MTNNDVTKELEIVRKTQTEMLINYLEGAIADEMIINQFVKPIKVHHIFDNSVTLSVPSIQIGNFLTIHHDATLKQGILEIFQKPYSYKFIDETDLKLMDVITKSKEVKVSSKGLLSKFQLSNYVEGQFNTSVLKAVDSAIKKPGEYSPLYISGKSGMGKTHLLHAVGNEVTKRGNSVYLVEANSFTGIITSLRHEPSKLNDFTDEFKKYDYLLFDDIQNIGDREVSLNILFRIINTHMQEGKQIIICSDKTQNELSGFEDRFITRFSEGLSVKIKNLEVEDVVKILQKKFEEKDLSPEKWAKEALLFIARNNTRDVRSIEAATKTVSFHLKDMSNISYTYDTMKSIFKDIILDKGELTYQRIIEIVCAYYKINKKDVLGKSRSANLIDPRYFSIYLIRELLDLTTVEIASIFNRDHSSISVALKEVKRKLEIQETARQAIKQIKNKITNVS